MKNIVLYIFPILLLALTDATAQKTEIDLLPSNHIRPHPEAIVDTTNTKDTVVMIIPDDKQIKELSAEEIKVAAGEKGAQNKFITGKESLYRGLFLDYIFQKMVSKKTYPRRILIFYITALNR